MIEYKMIQQHNDPDLIDFLNYVFSAANKPTDFIKLLPHVYEADAKPEVVHWSVQEDGRIRAMVSTYIYTLHYGELSLKVGYVGGVSVHPYHRSKGYMIKLMELAHQTMLERGCDVSMLSGQRQRYEYFGYYPGCLQAGMNITDTNLRHVLGRDYISPLEITEEFNLEEVYKVYRQQPVYTRSMECFEKSGRARGCRLLAVKEEGQVIGYTIANGDRWLDCVLPADQYLPALSAYMKKTGVSSVNLHKPLYDREVIGVLASVGGGGLGWGAMLKVLNWEQVLRWSWSVQKAEDGESQIGPYHVVIKDGYVDIQKNSDASMPDPNMMFHIFPVAEQERYPRGWFPLQLWVGQIDHF